MWLCDCLTNAIIVYSSFGSSFLVGFIIFLIINFYRFLCESDWCKSSIILIGSDCRYLISFIGIKNLQEPGSEKNQLSINIIRTC